MFVRPFFLAAALCACVTFLGTAAFGQDAASQRAAAFDRVVRCRSIADPQQRLACFEREVDALQQAESRKEVVIVDQKQIRAAKRSLFGIQLPKIAIFDGDNKDGADDAIELETTITSFGRSGEGGVSFTTAEGARWTQSDSRTIIGSVKPGSKVTLRRAAFGSYFAKLDGRPSFRAKRLN
ncbi:hypothetical protein [Sphingomonas xinjiangensis]|uniref:Uncharacterized protein n=1 Tax=Sphingomonas xinjiangensis TaxID=643568 RepID=A0A840YET7_9SPHN|nr:hypothetical protein [Sphingomonas xinjiangensis]MBB5711344.1 hypothetical protein [Sphingomonas xinjiangensis]